MAHMDGSSRLNTAIELSDAVREIRLAGIRSRHPELSPREAVARLVAEDYGVELPLQRCRRGPGNTAYHSGRETQAPIGYSVLERASGPRAP